MRKYFKKIIGIIVVALNMFMLLNVYAVDENIYSSGILKINGCEVDSTDTVLYNGDKVLVPLRTIFESLGATVNWDANEQSTIIDYKGKQYVCKISSVNKYSPDIKGLTVQNTKNLGRTDIDSYIRLNNMGVRGSFRIINDRTYLYQDTAERLFTALGCTVDVNSEEKCVYITAKEQVVTSLDRVKN